MESRLNLALLGEAKLDALYLDLSELEKDSNILEVIEQIFRQRAIEYKPRQLLFNDQLRAVFLLPKTNTIIDIDDKQFEHYETNGKLRLKHRGRVADSLAR